MTVIVGILCSDGVVIGSDSAMAAGRAPSYTIEWPDSGALKIEVIEPDVITAVTGAFGLAQRFNEQVARTIQALKEQYIQPTQFAFGPQGIVPIGTPIQQALGHVVGNGVTPYDAITPVQLGTVIAQVVTDDFKRTQSTQQVSNGWGLGALLAFVNNGKPQLIDFDRVQFHPEVKGMPDPQRGDHDRIARWVSMGIGQQMADAFLAHANRLLFDGKVPTIDRAKLVVAWAIDHVKRYHPGLVSGETRLAVLEKTNDAWRARHEDIGEAQGQVDALDQYIAAFRHEQSPDAAAAKSTVDLDERLAVQVPASQEVAPSAGAVVSADATAEV
jgi:hypothetical protein